METVVQKSLRSQLLYRQERLKDTMRQVPNAAHLVNLLQEVETALERIDDGTYGICHKCNEPIEPGYLRSYPLVTVCLSHLSGDQQRAVERDLELASKIQGKLLPVPHLHLDGWEFAYRYEPLGPVSGDYCDVVKNNDGKDSVYFFLGDVSGKGVAASLLMTQLHAIFHSLIAADLPLQQLVERANRVFAESTLTTHFATLVCGKAGSDGVVEICNAGHCPPLIVHDGVITRVGTTGFPLGLIDNSRYEVRTVQLHNNDLLLLYTDGLTEVRNSSEEEYGEERLASVVRNSGHQPPKQLIDTCLNDFTAFRNGTDRLDDLTIMVMKRIK
ncbi:MAG: SpoIIE family protein phosphatase [Ignavibacteriales bacterium]|nr:SpoIIE family protein phosphatase [Ignavibacteriales bacterium]